MSKAFHAITKSKNKLDIHGDVLHFSIHVVKKQTDNNVKGGVSQCETPPFMQYDFFTKQH